MMEPTERAIDRNIDTQPSADSAERIRQIRQRLPGQVLRERLDRAAAEYGPLYALAELQQRIAETLAVRSGCRRTAVLEAIESYRERIPDDALLRYDDAVASRLFWRFWVATPAYLHERQVDPWLVGEVADANAYAIIACWQ